MDSSLLELWNTASSSPFTPAFKKDNQFFVGFSLLSLGLSLIGSFLLHRSFKGVALLGLPASFVLGLGVVYMFCAVGVYV